MESRPFTPPQSEEAFLRWALKQDGVVFLDSGDAGYSSLRWGPRATKHFEHLADGELDAWLEAEQAPTESSHQLGPHLPGAVIFAGYEAARFFEPELPDFQAEGTTFPDLWAAVFDWSLVRSAEGEWQLWAVDLSLAPTLFEASDAPAPPIQEGEAKALVSKGEYLNAFEQVMKHIRDGVFYEANLTQPFVAEASIDAVETYLRLRNSSRPSWGAFVDFGGGQKLLSSSPECFLRREGDRISSEPIKGTRPRSTDPKRDRELAAELPASAKEHAELTMVVDMLRNDLARVSIAGSVEVPSHAEVVTLPHVHHMKSEIRALLKEGTTFEAILRATFPGGSITGAPKFSVISELAKIEAYRRGPYTGSLFALGGNGDFLSNILIRTIIVEDGRVTFNTGGGIVADSEAEAEYLECFHKARGILLALEPELKVQALMALLDSDHE